MASVASNLIEEVTAHAQRDRLEDAREICADGTYFPNNLRMTLRRYVIIYVTISLSDVIISGVLFVTRCNL
jgi:hypothetical protein